MNASNILVSINATKGSIVINQIAVPALDENGEPIYQSVVDDNGKPVLDESGEPVVKQVVEYVNDVNNYRVELASPLERYKDTDKGRVIVPMLKIVVPRKLMHSLIFKKMPEIAAILNTKFEPMRHDNIEDEVILKCMTEALPVLNDWLAGGAISLTKTVVSAGEITTAEDGSEIVYKMDGIYYSILGFEYNEQGKNIVGRIRKAQEDAMFAQLAAAIGI